MAASAGGPDTTLLSHFQTSAPEFPPGWMCPEHLLRETPWSDAWSTLTGSSWGGGVAAIPWANQPSHPIRPKVKGNLCQHDQLSNTKVTGSICEVTIVSHPQKEFHYFHLLRKSCIYPQSAIFSKLLMYDDLFGLNLGLLKSRPQATHGLRALQRLTQSWACTPTEAADSLPVNQRYLFLLKMKKKKKNCHWMFCCGDVKLVPL